METRMQIFIDWKNDCTEEYLEIDLDNLKNPDEFRLEKTREWSLEYGENGEFVYWDVTSKLVETDSGFEIIVRYEEEQSDETIRDLFKKDGSYCGENRIILEKCRRSEDGGVKGGKGIKVKQEGCFEWKSENNGKEKGRWKMIVAPRDTRNTKQFKRDEKFREKVLRSDKKRCVISGEKTVEVLDAAHICPVAGNGEDFVGNGITLRADIYRLYDRKIFLIDPCSGRIKLSSVHGLSKKYKRLLQKAELSEQTRSRVKKALQDQWKRARSINADHT